MFAPAVPEVMQEFSSTNVDLASFVVSVYILGYAFGPLVIAPMSELYGRLPVYHVNTSLFVLFNIACAKSTGLPMLVVFRFLAGIAGSCPGYYSRLFQSRGARESHVHLDIAGPAW
jgi:MFS family permease